MKEKNKFEIPILFITFNKKDTTKRVLKKILDINPSTLLIASDGPRDEMDKETIFELREYFDEEINFDFVKIYSDMNLGCKNGVKHAISEAFKIYDKLIILEDDTLPSKKFFKFSKKMLDLYEDDTKVNFVSGYNYLTKANHKMPFYFSKYSLIWGWATWRDRWANNTELNNENLKIFKNSIKNTNSLSNGERKYFLDHFHKVVDGKLDSWAFELSFSNFLNKKVTIVPKYNLVKNIGLGHKEATHTKNIFSFRIVTLNIVFSFFQSLKLNYLKPVISKKNDLKYCRKVILKNTFFNKISYHLLKKIYK